MMKTIAFSFGLLSTVLLATAAQAGNVDVDQVGQKFDKPSVTLKAGDTINFLNSDNVNHNVTVVDENGGAEDKGIQKPGTTVPVTFSKPGEYMIRCSVHPRMKMQVKVE
jgi:plastocyanin